MLPLSFIQQSCCKLQIGWCRYLDVLAVAFHHRHLAAKLFHHACIVGKRILELLCIGHLQHHDVEHLWRLYAAIVATKHVFGVSVLLDHAQCLGYWHHWNGRTCFESLVVAACDGL